MPSDGRSGLARHGIQIRVPQCSKVSSVQRSWWTALKVKHPAALALKGDAKVGGFGACVESARNAQLILVPGTAVLVHYFPEKEGPLTLACVALRVPCGLTDWPPTSGDPKFAQSIPCSASTGLEHSAQIPSQLHHFWCSLKAPGPAAGKGQNDANPQGFKHRFRPERSTG